MCILAFILTVNIVVFIVAFAFHVADIIVFGETGITAITVYELMSDWNIRLWVYVLLLIPLLPFAIVDAAIVLFLYGLVKLFKYGLVKLFKSPNIHGLFFKE